MCLIRQVTWSKDDHGTQFLLMRYKQNPLPGTFRRAILFWPMGPTVDFPLCPSPSFCLDHVGCTAPCDYEELEEQGGGRSLSPWTFLRAVAAALDCLLLDSCCLLEGNPTACSQMWSRLIQPLKKESLRKILIFLDHVCEPGYFICDLALCNPVDYTVCQAPLSVGFSRQE